MKFRTDRKFVTHVALSLLLGAVGSWQGQPLIHGNDQAINIIITVYSVMAGFLIAIIAILGEFQPAGSWRRAEGMRPQIMTGLNRNKCLFLMYLLSLAMIFLASLFKASYPRLTTAIEYLYMFLTCIAFFWSMRLPGTLLKLQQDRIDQMIEAKRTATTKP